MSLLHFRGRHSLLKKNLLYADTKRRPYRFGSKEGVFPFKKIPLETRVKTWQKKLTLLENVFVITTPPTLCAAIAVAHESHIAE